MATFEVILPTDIEKDVKFLEKNFEKIFGGMTKAGAEVAYNNLLGNLPVSLKSSDFRNCLYLSRTYRTPSDGAINNKVGIYGYFTNKNGKRAPAPLVANMFEFGSRKREYPYSPFFRRSFNKYQIEQAMKKAQTKLSGGLLK